MSIKPACQIVPRDTACEANCLFQTERIHLFAQRRLLWTLADDGDQRPHTSHVQLPESCNEHIDTLVRDESPKKHNVARSLHVSQLAESAFVVWVWDDSRRRRNVPRDGGTYGDSRREAKRDPFAATAQLSPWNPHVMGHDPGALNHQQRPRLLQADVVLEVYVAPE